MPEYRPCIVIETIYPPHNTQGIIERKSHKSLFHQWIRKIDPHYEVKPFTGGGFVIKERIGNDECLVAVVEYEDGTIHEHMSNEIQFTGGKTMTPNEYQKLAMRTCSIPYDDKRGMMYHATLGLASEAGEVAGIFQKEYQGHEISPDHVKKELGDCLWMIAEACTAMGFNMEDVMQTNIDKLKARFPDGFNPEQSIHRKDGDI